MKKVYGEMQKVCLGPKATKAYDKTFQESVKSTFGLILREVGDDILFDTLPKFWFANVDVIIVLKKYLSCVIKCLD